MKDSVSPARINRRQFLKIASLAGGGTFLVACAPVTRQATPTPGAAASAPKSSPAPGLGATPTSATTKPQRGGRLVYATVGEAGELDPRKTTVGATRRYARLLFNNLVMTDKDGNLVPELAESWSSPDPNTYVFKLRKGVKFHDGTDFNAEAVKFNIESIQDPVTKAPDNSKRYVTNIKSVEVLDDNTVRFNLKSPQAAFLANMTLYATAIVSPASVKKWGDGTVTHPVGTGPFEFVEWVKDDHLTVKRFDGYWRKDEFGDSLPYLDEMIVKPIPDRSVMLTNLRTGNVNLVGELLSGQLPLVEADKNLKVVPYGNSVYFAFINSAKPPFDNKALRQAVAWAVDRESILKSIYGGIGVEGKFILAPQYWAFDSNGKFYTRDLAKAKEKLAEGGKPNGFRFVAKSINSDLELRVAQAMKSQLAEVGIDMEIVPEEERQLSADRTGGQFEFIFTKAPGLPADPEPILDYYYTPIVWGKTYSNADVDKLLNEARVNPNQAERKARYAKAQALILDDSPSIFIRNGPIMAGMNQNVMGFIPNIDDWGLQFDWAWIKK